MDMFAGKIEPRLLEILIEKFWVGRTDIQSNL